MLDFLGTVITAALMVFVVAALAVYLDISRPAKLTFAALAGLWIGLIGAASAAGWLAISKPFPVMGIFVATPLIAAATLATSPAARTALLRLPTGLLVGLNIGRVFAVLFLLLGAEGRLGGPFPFFAGWGDIITGALAVPLLFVAAKARYAPLIFAWNLFGIADLVLAIFLGVTSADGSPLQLFVSPPGSAAMQQLPLSFVPAALVPFWLVLHAVVWAQIRTRTAGSVRAVQAAL
jgi:hypothetical protein